MCNTCRSTVPVLFCRLESEPSNCQGALLETEECCQPIPIKDGEPTALLRSPYFNI